VRQNQYRIDLAVYSISLGVQMGGSSNKGQRLPTLIFAIVGLAMLASGCASSSGEDSKAGEDGPRTTLAPSAKTEPKVPLPKGDPPKKLVIKDLRKGYGKEARKGDLLVTKLVAKFVDGRDLESSWAKGGSAFAFHLGKEEANPGWEKGVPGMRVGGRRELIIPPDEGSRFGTVGEGKPKDTLAYVVELVAISPPELEKRTEPKLLAPQSTAPSDLKVRDLIKGSGPAAREGDTLAVEYVGIRYDGRPFANSWKQDNQFRFQLGSESIRVNPGWEKGLVGMRVGGRRELVIPPKLQSASGAPANSDPSRDTLVYVIDLLGITDPDDLPPSG
jgi:FKBP-type peptidyl-prolyl cis-trans isomerase